MIQFDDKFIIALRLRTDRSPGISYVVSFAVAGRVSLQAPLKELSNGCAFRV